MEVVGQFDYGDLGFPTGTGTGSAVSGASR